MTRVALAAALATVLLLGRPAHSEDIKQLHQRGMTAQAQGDYGHAISSFTVILGQDPKNIAALNDRGWTYFLKKEYENALKDYGEIIRLRPGETFGYGNRANVHLYGTKDYDKAIADYSEVLSRDPRQFPDGYYKRGLCYAAKRDFDRAIADFDRAIELSANYAEAFHQRGLARVAKGDYSEAYLDYCNAKTQFLKRGSDAYIRAIKMAHRAAEDVKKGVPRDKITPAPPPPPSPETCADLGVLLATCPDAKVRRLLKTLNSLFLLGPDVSDATIVKSLGPPPRKPSSPVAVPETIQP